MKRFLAIATFALLFGSLSLLPTYAAQTSPQYTVTVPEQDKRLAKIEVRFSPKTDTILMYPEGANHLPDGWATFVRGLVAKTDAGAVIPLQYLGQARWKVSEPLPQNINLSYEILIHHDQGRWPFGHDEAAYAKRDCVFYTGASLFIGALDFEIIDVQFNVPSGWHVSTPWKEVAGKQNAFSVSGVEELINVGMLVGKHTERSVKIGNLEVILAVGQDLKESVDLFEATIKPLVPAAINLFGGLPVINGTPTGKFVVIANKDVFDGGGTFIRSISMLFKDTPDRRNSGEWGHIIAHEMLHLWNGQTIREAEQEYWFTEGFTDYLAYILETRTHLISEQELFNTIARKYDEYLAVAGKTGMRRAGDEKGKNYDLVYSGGLIAALALDIELRRKTKGAKGLSDFMQRMYREFGAGGKKYKIEDVIRVANSTADADLAAFFKEYVEGTKVIPLESYLAYLGLDVRRDAKKSKPQTVIRRRAKMTASEQAALSRLVGRPSVSN